MDGYAVLHELADSLPPSAWKPFSAHRPDQVAKAAANKKTRRKRKLVRAKWFRQAFVYIAAKITYGARRATVYLAGSHRFVEHLVIASQRLHTFTFQ